VGGITITPELGRTLAWSVPYFTTTLSLVVNGAKTPAIRSLTDLRHALVGVQVATTDYDAAVAMQQRGELGSIKVYPFDQIEQAMKDLEAGRITAVMKVAPVAAWLRAKALIYASWRKSQTTRGHSESGSGKISRGCWLP
jgi:ABC-type amino acid transport substrate-binding protein